MKPANGVRKRINNKPIKKYYKSLRGKARTGQCFIACLTELVFNFNPDIMKIIKMHTFAKGVLDITIPTN